MKKRSNLIQIFVFLGFIALFAVLFLAVPDKDFSEQENRYLAEAPKFTLDSLFEGKFTSKFESYLTDQFVGRDEWITLKAGSELALGKRSNNSVYLCEDDTLIERFQSPSQTLLDANIAAVERFTQSSDIPIYFALIPGAAEIWRDKLPAGAPCASQYDLIDYAYSNCSAISLDLYSALEAHSDEYIFYRTDHHWTTLGAYYGYEALMGAIGLDPLPLSGYSRRTVTEDFYGTVYSKSGMHWIRPDSIDVYESDAAVEVTNYSDSEPQEGALYVWSWLDKKDKYSMFMGGNTPLLTIKTENTEAPSLLIIRDSYADSEIPFLLAHFSEIHVLDLRYYKSSVSQYIADNGIDQVLISYSVSNFASDTSVSQLAS